MVNGAIFYFVARLVCFPSRYDRDQTGGRSGSFIAKKREINPKGDEERGGWRGHNRLSLIGRALRSNERNSQRNFGTEILRRPKVTSLYKAL